MSHTSTLKTFADEVKAIPGGEHLELCYSCGTCVSKCMIQQKLEPDYNPRRLLRMVMMDLKEEAFESPTTWLCSECDLCYEACPQEIHISQVIAAVKQLAVEAGYTSPLTPVEVNEDLCSGCGICVMVCPYEAPSLFEKEVNGEMDRFSQVDGDRCMGCGTCVAACPLGAIAREGVSNQEITIQLPEKGTQPPKLITFVCDWSLRESSDLALLESYPEDLVNVIHIPCTGRIDPQHAMMALNSGVEGVLVCGCKSGECHFKRGNHVASCKMSILDTMLTQFDFPHKHIRFVQIGTQERGRIRHEIDAMLAGIGIVEEVTQ
jgi:coenzyme F420-reducing hydrogenase delta subunit/heterodisulfide reductase subunit C